MTRFWAVTAFLFVASASHLVWAQSSFSDPASVNAAVQGLNTAKSAAQNSQAADYVLGGASLTGGAILANFNCCPAFVCHWQLCVQGLLLMKSGVSDLSTGQSKQGAINSLTGSDGATPCSSNPNDPLCFHDPGVSGLDNSGMTDSGLGNSPSGGGLNIGSLPPPIQQAYQQAASIGNGLGVDIGNPASVQSYLNKNGGGGGSGGGSGDLASLDTSKLPPDQKAAIEKAEANYMAQLKKFNLTDLDDDGAGGARFNHHGNGAADAGFDFKSMLDAANSTRRPASVNGLQKNFNGEPIGVAGDNIFEQVSRRYRQKIHSNLFILPAK